MKTSRSAMAAATVLCLGAGAVAPAAAQSRVVDEGTFVISRSGMPAQTEAFRIRLDNGVLLATGQLNAGTRRINSALTTDSLGTPLEYRLDVRDNGASTLSVTAVTRAGRLSARSQLARGDESMREYPVSDGRSLILEDDLVHQVYFVTLGRRSGSVNVIQPRSSHGGSLPIAALGLEPISIGGRQVTATHYSLGSGATRRDFWLDASGRVLQVEIPSLGLKATREELPR
jgi:hypothetical protein